MLRSTNAAGINVLATVKVKLEQLMNQILQEIINEQVVYENIYHDDYCELYFLYNLARIHVSDRASFWEYLRYFEDLSMLNPTTYFYPPVTLNNSDDEDPNNKDQKEKKKNPDYNPPRNSRFSSYTTEGGSEISSQIWSKSNTIGNNIESKETKENLLLMNIKNYDHNQFIFGHMLGYG
ncbi:unnamed protein product [Rhizophagus irregularis]|nr:unnamed protein product [Rhizophagus irregularis]